MSQCEIDIIKGRKLLTNNRRYVQAVDALKEASLVIFLFAASWCPDIDQDMLKLRQIYEENKKRGIGMEIVLVSSDVERANFDSFFFKKCGPWFAIPFNDQTSEEIRWKYGISSVPSILVLKPDGTIITQTGWMDLKRIGMDVLVVWTA